MNLAQLQRLRPKLEQYKSFVPAGQSFDYNPQAEDLVDTAETLEIELQGFMDKIHRESERKQHAASPKADTSNKDTVTTKQLEIMVPKFDGDRAKYKAFKSAITVLTQQKKSDAGREVVILVSEPGTKTSRYTREHSVNRSWLQVSVGTSGQRIRRRR